MGDFDEFGDVEMTCDERSSEMEYTRSEAEFTSDPASSFNYTVSSETYERFDLLDEGVRRLWDRLETDRDTLRNMDGSGQVQEFTRSLEKLKDDLNQSRLHHDRLPEQV